MVLSKPASGIVLLNFNGLDGIDVAAARNDVRKHTREVPDTGIKIGDRITWFDP
jgi:hypothetical protein